MLSLRVALLVVLVLSVPAWANPFSVDDWGLDVRIIPGQDPEVSESFVGAVNPFVDSHGVALDASMASASYDFAWDESGGQFDVNALVIAELVDDTVTLSRAMGLIDITPTVDLLFHADAETTYSLPTERMGVHVGIWANSGLEYVLLEEDEYDTASGETGSGTLSSTGGFVLTAGQTWSLGYSVRAGAMPEVGSVEGQVAVGTSSVSYTFEVIPEPSTLALVTLGGLAMLRRRRG